MKLLRDNGHAHCLNSAKQYNQIDNCAVHYKHFISFLKWNVQEWYTFSSILFQVSFNGYRAQILLILKKAKCHQHQQV